MAAGHVGASIGLLALDRLAEALGQKSVPTAQLSREIGTRSAALDAALKEQLPATIDDIVEHPLRAIAFRVEAGATDLQPFDPLVFRVSLRNTSRLPLAIGAGCPLTGRIVMRSAAPRAGSPDLMELPPQPLSIDRRLRLAPGETMAFELEAAVTDLGRMLTLDAASTHLVSANFVTNPVETPIGLAPGFLGGVSSIRPVHVAGAPLADEGWLGTARATIKDPSAPDRLATLALLCSALSEPDRLPEKVRGDAAAAWADVAAAWKTLPPVAQAWVVSVLPKETPAMAPLLDAVRASTEPNVLTSWLLGRVTDGTDPMLDVARRTAEPRLVRLASACAWIADRRNKRAMEQSAAEAKAAADAKARGATKGGGGTK